MPTLKGSDTSRRPRLMLWNLTKHSLCAQFVANSCYHSLVMAWKMRQTEDPFHGNLVHGAHRRSSLWDFTVARILRGILTNHCIFNLRNWWSNDWEKNVGNDSWFSFLYEIIAGLQGVSGLFTALNMMGSPYSSAMPKSTSQAGQTVPCKSVGLPSSPASKNCAAGRWNSTAACSAGAFV